MKSFILVVIYVLAVVAILAVAVTVIWLQYRRIVREAKNYERGLKMIPLRIHLPPSSTDLDHGSRDQRDVTDEVISQSQVMYNIIASTVKKGFKSSISGQRHLSFELVSEGGLIHYYAVVPVVLVDIVRQAVLTAYPSAILEEVRGENIFNKIGKTTGTIGGEFSLKRDAIYPIATYQDTKQDASRSILNALSAASKEDGIAIQILLRPAAEKWTNASAEAVKKIRKEKSSGVKTRLFFSPGDLLEALWKPPEVKEQSSYEEKQLTSLEQAEIEAIEGKTRYPGFETLIRVVVSSNTIGQAQAVMQNVVSAFSLFDSPQYNGFRFNTTKNVDALITSYIMRFFPQEIKHNILNSVELATIYHLPTQKDIPTAQVKRQTSKQVDGPTEAMTEGLLLGYNEFRGVKKPIRLGSNDRRRHTYFIGQTGTGKSVLLENLAYQDMMAGRGFAFIDPHGDSAEKILGMVPRDRVDDIVYFNPGDIENPIGMNMFEFTNEDQKDFIVQEGINMLQSLYDPGNQGIFGPRAHHMFRNAALLLMSDPEGGTFIDIPQCFIDPEFVGHKLRFVTDKTVHDYWTKEFPSSQKSSEAGEVVTWFVSKWGPFLSNQMMRNILGQRKSGFNIRDIMDNNKILIVNLSKGKTGELNSMLLGMIFIMKFQVAAMSRASIPEDQRTDFCLYVDEFQNFATDSFESILSEARKYRLNIIVANQFMTQLTDKIREAIIGNVGTIISGRIGITDAEVLQKRFAPEFEVEDLTKLPNYHTVASVLINNVPSSPFSMTLIPPMGKSNPQLADALKKLSSSKFGLTRREADAQITERLSIGDRQRRMQLSANQSGSIPGGISPSSNTGFLDEWLTKRKQLSANVDKNDTVGAVVGLASPGRMGRQLINKTGQNEGSIAQDAMSDLEVGSGQSSPSQSGPRNRSGTTVPEEKTASAEWKSTAEPGAIDFRSAAGQANDKQETTIDLR